MKIEMLNPQNGLVAPNYPYLQIARVKASELVFIAGQVSFDASEAIIGIGDFEAQCDQVFENIHLALRAVNGDWGNIVNFTSYLVRYDDVPDFVSYRRRNFQKMFSNGMYPPNTLVIVNSLAKKEFLIEISATAAL